VCAVCIKFTFLIIFFQEKRVYTYNSCIKKQTTHTHSEERELCYARRSRTLCETGRKLLRHLLVSLSILLEHDGTDSEFIAIDERDCNSFLYKILALVFLCGRSQGFRERVKENASSVSVRIVSVNMNSVMFLWTDTVKSLPVVLQIATSVPYTHSLSSIYVYSCCSNVKHGASVKRFVSLQFLNIRQSVGLLGLLISPSQGRYLHRTTQTQNKRRQTSIPWVGFEPTIPGFERAKIVHALDRATTAVCYRHSSVVYFKCRRNFFYVMVHVWHARFSLLGRFILWSSWVMAPYSLVSELNILEAHMASYCRCLEGYTSTLRMETAYYAQILRCCSQILNAFIVDVIMNLWGESKLNLLGTFLCVYVFCSNFTWTSWISVYVMWWQGSTLGW
jgi:hypothetical protein